ncbi:MAG: electron transport complex subunit RsxG [Pseudomonadota bacterium]|nr:MAG: electron transport complex subunit RsxG [Pseudomonadota bacterium]
MNLARNMTVSAILLGAFAITGTGLLALTHQATRERIAQNERELLLRTLNELVPGTERDNDPYSDITQVLEPGALGSDKPVTVYRARKEGQPVAAIINAVAPDGYSGRIGLLVAVRYDGTLAGVRVTAHRETPGLGDAIETSRSDWILGFDDKSLDNPRPRGWRVKRDGGEFDQFTGATVTPRAIVRAVFNTLRYFESNREAMFAPAQGGQEPGETIDDA